MSNEITESKFLTLLQSLNLVDFISYVVWTSVAVYCLREYGKKYGRDVKRFGYAMFLLTLPNAALGLTEIFGEDVMYSLRNLLELLQLIIAFPSLNTEFWLKYKVATDDVAWAHTAIGLVPLYVFIIQHFTRQDLVDFTVFTNVLSMGAVGIAFRNAYGVCAAVLVFVAHAFLYHRPELGTDMPSRQLYNYVMALFTFLGYKAIM